MRYAFTDLVFEYTWTHEIGLGRHQEFWDT